MIKACCVFTFLLFLVFIKIHVEAVTTCPAGYTEVTSSCYKIFPSQIYSAGQSDCEAEGGHLATLTSATEVSDVSTAFSADIPFWFGLTDASSVWAWVNGEAFVYIIW